MIVDDMLSDERFMAHVGTLHLFVDGESTLYTRLSMREQQELADNLPEFAVLGLHHPLPADKNNQ